MSSYIIQDIIPDPGVTFGISDSNRVNPITKYELIDLLNKQSQNTKDITFVLPSSTSYITIVFQVEEVITSSRLSIAGASKNGVDFNFSTSDPNKFYKFRLNSEKTIGDSKYTVTLRDLEIEVKSRLSIKYLLNYEGDYYYINDYIKKLGKPKDNKELVNWYRTYGIKDLNIILKKVNEKNINLIKQGKYLKTEFPIDFNNVKGHIKYIGQNVNKVIYATDECQMIDVICETLSNKIKICKMEEEIKWLNSWEL